MHKYEVLATDLRSLVATMSAHEPLPSERDLMVRYGVSRATVRQAIGRLVDEGRLYNVHGSGTFAGSNDLFTKSPKLTSFTEDMRSRGFEPSSRVLSVSSVRASATTVAMLQLDADEKCTQIRRLRLADGHPMALEEVTIPARFLEVEDFDMTASLYEQFAARDLDVYRAEQEVQAVSADSATADLLGLAAGGACLHVTRVGSTRRGLLVEHGQTWYRGDRYSFQFAVTREHEK